MPCIRIVKWSAYRIVQNESWVAENSVLAQVKRCFTSCGVIQVNMKVASQLAERLKQKILNLPKIRVYVLLIFQSCSWKESFLKDYSITLLKAWSTGSLVFRNKCLNVFCKIALLKNSTKLTRNTYNGVLFE